MMNVNKGATTNDDLDRFRTAVRGRIWFAEGLYTLLRQEPRHPVREVCRRAGLTGAVREPGPLRVVPTAHGPGRGQQGLRQLPGPVRGDGGLGLHPVHRRRG